YMLITCPRWRLLDPHGATERPAGIVRFRTVVIDEDMVEAAIAKEGSVEFPDFRRCFHPARRFRIELTKFLQLSILFFRQKLDAHGSCHTDSGIFWLIFFPSLQRFMVVTNTSAAFRTFG